MKVGVIQRPAAVNNAPRFSSTEAQVKPASTAAPDLGRVGSCWDDNSKNWTQVIRSGRDVFRTGFLDQAFYRFLGPVNNLDVLDAGCGEGSLCRRMAGDGGRVVGLDLSKKLIREARLHPDNSKLNLRFKVGSFTDLKGIASQKFDRVVSSMALMDSPDLPDALKSFFRVLRPGGELVFSIKHPFMTLKNLSTKVDPETSKVSLSFDGSYFDSNPFEKTVDFDKGDGNNQAIKTIHYPKTMAVYMNALRKAGFTHIRLEEPRPTDALCRENPKMLRYQKIPSVLMVRAEKAAGPSMVDVAGRWKQSLKTYLTPLQNSLRALWDNLAYCIDQSRQALGKLFGLSA